MSESVVETSQANSLENNAGEQSSLEQHSFTSGFAHWFPLGILDRTGLPSWQLGLSLFLFLALFGLTSVVLSSVPDPEIYPKVVAFVAIISFFLVLYLELARGWYKDLLDVLDFDKDLIDVQSILQPSQRTRFGEIFLALCCGTVNFYLNDVIPAQLSFLYFASWAMYWLEYILVFFCVDIFFRQLVCLNEICNRIRINLLEADVYAVLANPMLRFLRLYISGLCIVFASYTVFISGDLGFNALWVLMMPFYLPGLIMLGLFLKPFRRLKNRIHVAKTLELNHVHRAMLMGDKVHLNSTLIGEDADRLHRVDLMYYEDRIRKIKEWPFTDKIRGMLLFGVLPPLTWVIAALIEIFIEGVI